MYNFTGFSLDSILQRFQSLDQGLQTMARGPNPARQDISSDSRRHLVNNEKIMYLQNFIDFVEYNISRNNPIT